MRRKTLRLAALLLILTLLSACAHAADAPAENTPAPTATPAPTPDAAQELIDMFGSGCMTEYIQQLTLDGFDGEVWFVPYRPFYQFAYTKIIQNGETLAQLRSRDHEGYGGEDFCGFDSVASRDLNGDGKTDIVIIERFGDERFAELFFSTSLDTDDPEERFFRDDELGRALESRAAICSVPLTAEWVADMVHVSYDGSMEVSAWAGEFDDWRTAYRAAAEHFEQECLQYNAPTGPSYSLIDVDGDNVPEMAAFTGKSLLPASICTFRDGTLYMPARRWGLEYIPGENSVIHTAGGLLNSIWYYIEIGPEGEWRTNAVLKQTWFADPDGNGILDSDEPIKYDYIDKNGNGMFDLTEDEIRITYWRAGEKISREEFESYGYERYEMIQPELSFHEFIALLDEYGTD